ncbi:MAG: phosphoribosylamine--glycine ligase, partial [Candidatus Aminicenantes bacterium]
MKILVIGSGGREHALAWKISQSPHLEKLFCAPGNPGTMSIAENVAIDSSDIKGLTDFAAQEKIGLTVVGPEVPLTMGIVDEFEERGLKIFGPDKKTAELEGSKVFAKQFMERHQIPTAVSKIAESPEEATEILNSGKFSFPLVVKADGLAAGKGVIICENLKEAEE